ncbi:MAG TPA: thioesterase domain-containing protein [Ktedonobacteraceae bacterium]|jgi:medium-chain acyl-[acyl-carrier-protein] hydrolase
MTDIAKAGSWIEYWQQRPQARMRLFCFPYAGGGASLYRNWSKNLPAQIEVCPVQFPGRENRLWEEPFAHLPALVEQLSAVLLPYLQMPYAFFGHSMGALIAFELTRALRRQACTAGPAHLFVSGHRAPQIADPDPPSYALPTAAFIETLRELDGTPAAVLQNDELLQLLLPLLRADFSVCETYRYHQEKPLRCPLTAFGGLLDKSVAREVVISWREQTCGPFKARFFAGDHFFLEKEQQAVLGAVVQDLYAFFA